MKTLIINGSPRKKGETSAMTRWVREHVEGEVKEVFTYDMKVRPCVDCRYCADHESCCVEDEMQELIQDLVECDNLLLASPIYFSELTGSFLSVISRLQPYFYGKYVRKEPSPMKEKRGAVAIVYGGKPRESEKPYSTASVILKLMNAQGTYPFVCASHSDDTAALDQKDVMEALRSVADLFNSPNTAE